MINSLQVCDKETHECRSALAEGPVNQAFLKKKTRLAAGLRTSYPVILVVLPVQGARRRQLGQS